MATTPNFGWVTPSPTDFVTDLPADFETFADAVDADVQLIKNTADAALPETLIDAAGDLIYGSAADTAARLPIGTAGQVLTVNSGATAPEWGTVAANSWTLLTSGNITSGLTQIELTSISQNYRDLVFIIRNLRNDSASARWGIQVGDSSIITTNYYTGSVENATQQYVSNDSSGVLMDNNAGAGDNIDYIVTFHDYTKTSSERKLISYVGEYFSSIYYVVQGVIMNRADTNPITRIKWVRNGGTGTTSATGNYALYGVK